MFVEWTSSNRRGHHTPRRERERESPWVGSYHKLTFDQRDVCESYLLWYSCELLSSAFTLHGAYLLCRTTHSEKWVQTLSFNWTCWMCCSASCHHRGALTLHIRNTHTLHVDQEASPPHTTLQWLVSLEESATNCCAWGSEQSFFKGSISHWVWCQVNFPLHHTHVSEDVTEIWLINKTTRLSEAVTGRFLNVNKPIVWNCKESPEAVDERSTTPAAASHQSVSCGWD